MRIVLLLEYRRCELFLLVIKRGPPLRINSVKVLSNHLDTRTMQSTISTRCPGLSLSLIIASLHAAFPDATRPEHAPAVGARDC